MLHTTIPATEIINGNVPTQLNFDVNFNDTGIASGVRKYTIQASTDRPVLLRVQCEVITAFNAGTTNVLTLGTNSTANQLLAAGDITEATPGFYPQHAGTGSLRITAATDIYAKYTQTGTAATTGKAKFYLTVTPLYQGT